MANYFVEAVQKLMFLVRDTQENTASIEKIRKDLRQLAVRVEALAFEVEPNKQNEQHEREKFALQIENVLLRFERRLPSGN